MTGWERKEESKEEKRKGYMETDISALLGK